MAEESVETENSQTAEEGGGNYQSPPSGGPGDSLAEKITAYVCKWFTSFPAHGKPQEGSWTVLSALVAVNEPLDGSELTDKCFTLIGLATGLRCVTGPPARTANVVVDCHAEVLLKRAFKRYLIGKLLKSASEVKQQQTPDSHQQSSRGGGQEPEQQQPQEQRYLKKEAIVDKSVPPANNEENADKSVSTPEFVPAANGTEVADAVAVQENGAASVSASTAAASRDSPTKTPKVPIQVDLSAIYNQKYYMFVSQLPCGVAHRYHGEKEVRTNRLRRKPGKGEPVTSPSCVDKIARWLRLGWQGRRLLQVIKKPITLSGILVGSSVQDKEYDEDYFRQRLSMRDKLSRKWNPYLEDSGTREPPSKKSRIQDDLWSSDIHETLHLMHSPNFQDKILTRTPTAQSFPTALCIWREEFEKGQGPWKMGREIITSGRRSGTNSHSYKFNPLKICNMKLDEDIDTIFKEYGIRRPKTEEEDLILQYEKKWKEMRAQERFKGWGKVIRHE